LGGLHQISQMKTHTTIELKRGQIGNHQWAFDWPYVLWSLMNLNWPTSRSSKLHAKYCDYGDRYYVGVNGGQI